MTIFRHGHLIQFGRCVKRAVKCRDKVRRALWCVRLFNWADHQDDPDTYLAILDYHFRIVGLTISEVGYAMSMREHLVSDGWKQGTGGGAS